MEFVTNTEGDESDGNDEIEGSASQINESAGSSSITNQELPSLMPTIEEIDVVEEHAEIVKPETSHGLAGMQLEIHTDEHGQIVNIQQTLDGNGVVFADIGDINISVSICCLF